jgi:UV DNA damage endonuclease
LHIGGAYGNKQIAMQRFKDNYVKLNDAIKQRLVIENDDRIYNIVEVLEIGNEAGIPVVFDNLHNQINATEHDKEEKYWINECKSTWKAQDGNQKIHYSQQNSLKKLGSHSETIHPVEFLKFCQSLQREDIDIMLEVKDKNLSAIKCMNYICSNKNQIKRLEKEWSRYKYKILENSPADYLTIRKLLRDKNTYPVQEFYELIEHALGIELATGNAINAALHVWGYFKKIATEKEKASFLKTIENFELGKITIGSVKNNLWKLTKKYHEDYLLESYYFGL